MVDVAEADTTSGNIAGAEGIHESRYLVFLVILVPVAQVKTGVVVRLLCHIPDLVRLRTIPLFALYGLHVKGKRFDVPG